MRLFLGLLLIFFPFFQAHAQGSHEFFHEKSPREMFSEKVTEPLDTGVYLLREPTLFEPEEESESIALTSGSPPERARAQIPTSREEIISQFGTPEGNEPVKAIDDAPRPFQGMMAAI